jgi:hypothetical protein
MEKSKSEKRPFNRRALVSVAMFASGIILPFSGIMNHNLQFETLTMQRHFWMSLHNISAILFVIFAIIHIILNRSSLLKYIVRIKNTIISKEAALAIFIVVFIAGMFSMHALHIG